MRRRVRWLRLIAIGAIGLALIAITILWAGPTVLLSWTIARALERQGFGPARLVVTHAGQHSLDIHDLSLFDGAIRVKTLTLQYDLEGLALHRVDRIDIGDLDVSGTISHDGLLLGGHHMPTSGGGQSSGLIDWQIGNVVVPDAHLALDGVGGKLAGSVSGNLALRPRDGGGRQLVIADGTIKLDTYPWTAEEIGGSVDLVPGRIAGEIALGRVVDRHEPALVAPLRVTANATMTDTSIDFGLRATANGKTPATLAIAGHHDPISGRGTATLDPTPLQFTAGGLQLADLSPAFGHLVDAADGKATMAGSVGWAAGEVTPNLTLKLDGLSFATSVAKIRQLNASINLVHLWPPATAPAQPIDGTIEIPGFPPATISLAAELLPKPSLALGRLNVAVAGGRIAATPFTIESLSPDVGTTLTIAGVDLAEVTRLGIDGLSGTGQLDGTVPLAVADTAVTIADGALAARGPGTVRYQPHDLPPQIAGGGPSVALALQALSDFHYDRLALDLDKAAAGDGTVLLRLQGQNPAVLGGRPFNFNIRVDSNFDRLVRYAILSLSSAQALLRQAAGSIDR